MPNGADRNFVRFISCIGGFKTKFNKWPTRMRLDPEFIDELKEVMDFDDFQKLNGIIELVSDSSNPWDGLYIAEDNDGNLYDLMESGHYSKNVDVLEWLDISWPDYGPD